MKFLLLGFDLLFYCCSIALAELNVEFFAAEESRIWQWHVPSSVSVLAVIPTSSNHLENMYDIRIYNYIHII